MSYTIVPGLSRKQIEDNVQKIKLSCGLENSLYFPVMHFVENVIPLVDNTFVFRIAEPNELSSNEYAHYTPNTNELIVDENVYTAACAGNTRHRFTIAHESGHYFLHKDLVSYSRVSNRENISKYCDPEWQANVFASNLLASPTLIRYLSIEDVSRECGMSYQAAKIAVEKSKKSQTLRLSSFT